MAKVTKKKVVKKKVRKRVVRKAKAPAPEAGPSESTVQQELNKLRVHGILADDIPLGDVLFRLLSIAARTGRSSMTSSEEEGLNRDAVEGISKFLSDPIPVGSIKTDSMGFDPHYLLIRRGEAQSFDSPGRVARLIAVNEKNKLNRLPMQSAGSMSSKEVKV